MLKQRRDGTVRLCNGEGNLIPFGAHFFYGRKPRQFISRCAASIPKSKLDNMLAAQSGYQFGRRTQRNDVKKGGVPKNRVRRCG
jgi:hypothetical protein